MKLLIIENNSERAVFYTENGIDRIFVDLEYLGKEVRQKNMDTVKSFSHKYSDVKKIKDSIKKGELLVRINPINSNSVDEINEVIDYGADLIMLPYFKTIKEVDFFFKTVNNSCKTILLVETPQAFTRLPNYINFGFDELYLGLNDLHLGLGLDFMFEPLAYGLVEYFAKIANDNNIPFGFGGLADLNEGIIPGKLILSEHVRLGSSMVILSRTFKNNINDNNLYSTINSIRDIKNKYKNNTQTEFNNNKELIIEKVNEYLSTK